MNSPLIHSGELLVTRFPFPGLPCYATPHRSVEAASTSKLCLDPSSDPSSENSSHSAPSCSSPELQGPQPEPEPEPARGPKPARRALDPEPEGFPPPWGGPRACKCPGLDST